MLSINMNQDVEQYQESVAAGLNAKQTIAAILAMVVVAVVTCILSFGIGLSLNTAVFLAVPVSVPVILPAMGKQYGLTVMERFKGSNKRKQVIAYAVTHTLPMTEHRQETAEEKRKQERKFPFKIIRKKERINETGEEKQFKKESSQKRQIPQSKK